VLAYGLAASGDAPAATAGFTWSPAVPVAGQPVTFSSTSSDTDDLTLRWKLDADEDFDDAIGDSSPTTTFAEAGKYTVGLRLTDPGDAVVSEALKVVTVQIPLSFSFFPADPMPGEQVLFFVPDPPPSVGYAWDMDGNGTYERATGTATFTYTSFPTTGARPVGLRVTRLNDPDAFGVATRAVTVRSPADPSKRVAAARLLSPFPVVRIAGRVTRRGAYIRRLTVNAPRGASVLIRCRGRSCPFRRAKRVKVSSGAVNAAKTLRVRRLERRLLRAGTRVEVSVSRAGAIGKFTRFTIRKRRPPARTDLCLVPGAPRPLSCPPS
jgi:hypothetical protein